MNILFADCFSGISGDMFLGALIDLGIDRDWLYSELSSLGTAGFTLELNKVKRGSIQCTQCKVISQDTQDVKRGIQDITEMIEKSCLKKNIKAQAVHLFRLLAEVESEIHGIPLTDVHFHELGAIDSFVEIIGTLIGYDHLEIDAFYASPIPIGRGITNTQHGPIPIPSPATVKLLEGIPVIHTGIEAELVTPTGALLLKHLAKKFESPPKMVFRRVGYGAGERDLRERPNCLRLIQGESETKNEEEYIEVLECDIDDMNPEFFPNIMEKLFDAGALDVSLSQIIMKKGRPGIKLTALCEIGLTNQISNLLLTETSTLGVRFYQVRRSKMTRKIIRIQTQYGPARVKCAWKDKKIINIAPEYEDYSRISRKYNRPAKSIYQEIIAEALKQKINMVDNTER